MQIYGFDEVYNAATHNPISDWLYEDDWSKQKLAQYELLTQVPVVNRYLDWLLDLRSDEEYLHRYGMDYSDIHDPRKLHQTGSAGALVGSAVNFVSSNIKRLYG